MKTFARIAAVTLVVGGVVTGSAVTLADTHTGIDSSGVLPAERKHPAPMPSDLAPRQAEHADRQGSRKPLQVPQPKQAPAPKEAKPAVPEVKEIQISSYAWCPNSVQTCVDKGLLTGYHTNWLAGHNYMGYQWLSRVTTGSIVKVSSGPLAGSYRVYGHIRLGYQGGAFPNTGDADLVLQSCEGSGTGLSLAHRI